MNAGKETFQVNRPGRIIFGAGKLAALGGSIHLIMGADGDRDDGAALDQEVDGDARRKVDRNGVQVAQAALQLMEKHKA